MSFDLQDLEKRMKVAIENLKKEFSGLRTGRANVALLDPIQVEAYGSMMPLSAVASVNTPEARMLAVQVWDTTMVKAVEKAIRDSDLGLNPNVDGQILRIILPPLTEERRKDLQKIAGQYAEAARVTVRSIRRDGNDMLKKQEKAGEISEDSLHKSSEKVQKLTDRYIAHVDEELSKKQEDIMQV